ncbi:hypothetical protein [uncultured Ferrimonas sp.]|uniref:hypothetical protein n=1 Tax=uncultured Ferrimonas sp. TaxID=432640 RepID=UPI002615AC23|nr:hypothetical protein [uncultured Ferrimonas sp.]
MVTILIVVALLVVAAGYWRQRQRKLRQPPKPFVFTPSNHSGKRPCPRCKYTMGYRDSPCTQCKVYR